MLISSTSRMTKTTRKGSQGQFHGAFQKSSVFRVAPRSARDQLLCPLAGNRVVPVRSFSGAVSDVFQGVTVARCLRLRPSASFKAIRV